MSAPPRRRGHPGRTGDQSVRVIDDDGVEERCGSKLADVPPRDRDLILAQRMGGPISMRRRDVDPVMVDRIVHGRSPLLAAPPCDRVEAIRRLRAGRPDWDDVELGRWVGCDADTVAVHDTNSDRFRYGWLNKGARGGEGEE